jgi:hypothetical protein
VVHSLFDVDEFVAQRAQILTARRPFGQRPVLRREPIPGALAAASARIRDLEESRWTIGEIRERKVLV